MTFVLLAIYIIICSMPSLILRAILSLFLKFNISGINIFLLIYGIISYIVFFSIIFIIGGTSNFDLSEKLLYMFITIVIMCLLEGFILKIKYSGYLLPCYKISFGLNAIGVISFIAFNSETLFRI